MASVVAEYLDAAHAKGFAEVRLIHGRGIGVQRKIVQSVLERHPLVAGYADAPPERCRAAFEFRLAGDAVVSFNDRQILIRADRD